MRPKTISVLEVPRCNFYDLGTLQGGLLQMCENFEYPSPFDYCEGRVELGNNALILALISMQILWNCYTRNHITQTILLRD